MDALDFIATPVECTLGVHHCDGGPVRCCEGWDDVGKAATRAHLLRASGFSAEGHVRIALERHAILRYTPCGAWIDTFDGDRFVNLRAHKQWASATATEATDQLYHRKRAQVRILAGRLADAEAVQAAMEKHLGKKAPPPRPRYYGSGDYDY